MSGKVINKESYQQAYYPPGADRTDALYEDITLMAGDTFFGH